MLRPKFGLDRPLPERLLAYPATLLQGDLGTSFVHGRPVVAVIAERLPATLLLMSTALALSSVAGVALGALAARRAGGPLTSGSGGRRCSACHTAVLAGAGRRPRARDRHRRVSGAGRDRRAPGWTGPALRSSTSRTTSALPALVLAADELALTTRLVRTGLLEALGTDYVRTARAKGSRTPSCAMPSAMPCCRWSR